MAGGPYSTVSGGLSNSANSTYATISGGQSNSASGLNTTVSGGYTNVAGANYATVGGGYFNTASDNYATVGGGVNNTASGGSGGPATVGGGGGNTASGAYSTVSGGLNALAVQFGQNTQASGLFTQQGDAQTSVFVVRNSTSSATATDLFLDGSGGGTSIAVPSSGAMNFHVHIIGKTTGSPAAVGGWDVCGVIYNNSGTTTIMGTNVTITYNTPSGWSVPTVFASGGNLIIQVTGAASTNIRWVARVETAEVTY